MGESLDDVKFLLRSVLMSEKDGVEARKLEGFYRELADGPVPYRTFGFSDRESFLRSMPDVVSIQRTMAGIVYVGVATPETAHIQRLKSRERSNRKSSKGKPMKGVLRKLTPRRPAWSTGGMFPASSHYPGPSSRSFHPSSRVNFRPPRPAYNRPAFTRPPEPPRRRPSPELWESQSTHKTPNKMQVYTDTVNKTLRMANQYNERNAKKIVRETGTGSLTIEVKRTPPKAEERKPLSELESIKFGDNYEVPPRFKRKTKPDDVKGNSSAAITSRSRAKSPVSPNLSANRQKSPVPSQFKAVLNEYAQKKKFGKLTYDTITASIASRCGYVSSVRIEGKVYGSLEIFRTKREAEDAAAKNALSSLDLLLDIENIGKPERREKSPVTSQTDEYLLRERISQILAKHPNGLWNTRLSHEYEDTYSEKLPSNLNYSLEKEWTDLIRMESVQGTDSKILYLQPAMSPVKQAENELGTSWKIAPAELPQPGTKAQVYACHIVDWLHFYVQRADSPIENIRQDLARGCLGKPQYVSYILGYVSTPRRLKCLSSLQEFVRKVSSPEPGMYCIAKYPIDNQWYRARIVSVRSTETQVDLDVCYVDFGNYESVNSDNIGQLSAKLCQQPAQGIKMTLHDVHPIMDRNFDQIVESAFKEFIGADEGLALLVDVITVDADKGCSVKLYRANDLKKSINTMMIEKGFAVDYPPGHEPGYLELQENKEWNVYVSYINTTTDIIVRLVGPDYSDKLEELEDNLSSLEKRACLKGGVKVGLACALRAHAEDGSISWYRVKIERFEGDKVWVSYLDHGDKECVSLESLRHLTAEFLQLPYQALSCRLTGLEAFVKDQKVLSKLCDLALGKTCVAEVDCRVNSVSLTLFDTSGEEDLNINETVAQVLSVEELRPKLPKIGSTVEGYVSYITEDGRIFFQELGPGLQRLDEIMTEISDMYDKQTGASLFLGQPEEGLCCVAKCAFDNKWYRAQIVQVLPGRMVEVSFVDYGNCEELPYSSLRCFPETHKYFQTLPFQVVECQLPNAGRWTPEAVNRFLELAPPEKSRFLEVQSSDSDDTDLPLVDILFFTEDNELVSICDEILEPEKLFLSSDEEDEAAGMQEECFMESLVQSSIQDELEEAFCHAPSPEFEADTTGSEKAESSGQHVCKDYNTVQQKNVVSPDTIGSSVTRTEYLHHTPDRLLDDNSKIQDTSLSSNDKSISDEVSFLVQYLPNQLKAPYSGASQAASSDLVAGSDPVFKTGSSVSKTPEPVTPDSELESISREMKSCDINENSGIPRPGVIPSPKPNLDVYGDLYQQAVIHSGDDIYVTYVCDPTNFKCISESTRLALNEMMDALQTYYQRNDGLVPPANSLEIGKVYAGYHTDDNWWYRVVIKTVLLEAQQVSVKFVDYGDFSILGFQDLRFLDDQFLELPFQAVDAKLAGVRKLEHRWSKQATERFRELAFDKVLTAWIHGKEQDNVVSMTLIHAEGSQNAFIHKVLIEEGLAASC